MLILSATNRQFFQLESAIRHKSAAKVLIIIESGKFFATFQSLATIPLQLSRVQLSILRLSIVNYL